MALAKHHEEIGERLLHNLQVQPTDVELRRLLDDIGKRYSSRLNYAIKGEVADNASGTVTP